MNPLRLFTQALATVKSLVRLKRRSTGVPGRVSVIKHVMHKGVMSVGTWFGTGNLRWVWSIFWKLGPSFRFDQKTCSFPSTASLVRPCTSFGIVFS